MLLIGSMLLLAFVQSPEKVITSANKLVNTSDVSPLKNIPQSSSTNIDVLQTTKKTPVRAHYQLFPNEHPASTWSATNYLGKVKLLFSDHRLQLRPLLINEHWTLDLQLIDVTNLSDSFATSNPSTEIDFNKIKFVRPHFIEWYLNSPSGIEHGFTITSLLNSNSSVVSFTVALGGNISVQEKMGDLMFFSPAGKLISQYSHLNVFDANHKKLKAELHYDNMVIRISVDTANAVFPITVDPIVTVPRSLVGPALNDVEMGIDVDGVGDLNGDGIDDVIVGMHGYNNRGGGIQVYLGSDNGLILPPVDQSWLISPGLVNSGFGASVSGAGDIDNDGFADVIVGAWQFSLTPARPNQPIGSREGAFFVYYGSSTGLTREQRIDGVQAGGYLGFAVGRAGFVNADKYADIIVSAPNYSGQSAFAGRVFVYFGSAGGILADPWYTEMAQANMFLGSSVNTVGDVNGDTYDDFIIGAIYYDHSRTFDGQLSLDSGGAFLHFGSQSMVPGPAATTPIEFVIDSANANFGVSVDGAGDVNRDGFLDIIVGANLYTDSGPTASPPRSGAITVFFGPFSKNVTPTFQQYMGTQNNENFGYSVSGLGDVNGDGYPDVSVSAFQHDSVYINDGAVFVLYGGIDGLNQNIPFDAAFSDPRQADSQFGISAKAAGDVNNDGYRDLIVGANLFDRTNVDQGQAFLFEGRGNSDISVSVTDSFDTVSPGTEVAYSIIITNNGPDPAKRLQLVNSLPLGAEFVAATSANWICDPTPNGSNQLWCRLDTLATLSSSEILVNLILNAGNNVFGTQVSANVVDQFVGNNQDSDLTLVTVTPPLNSAPTAENGILDISEDSGQTIAYLIGNDVDPDTLTYEVTTQPVLGSLSVVKPTGEYFYTPFENKNGTDSFKFRVFDGALYSQPALITIKIAPVQDLPVANTDSYFISEDSTTNRLLKFSDPDLLDTLNFKIITAPSQGIIAFTDIVTGAYEYSPSKNYFGADYFTFNVSDGTATSAEARVDITIDSINDVPIVEDQVENAAVGQPFDGFLLGTDVEASPLIYSVTTEPTKGSLSVVANTGEFTYTAYNESAGIDSFSFIASDGENSSEPGKITFILNINSAPAAATLYSPGNGVSISALPISLQWFSAIDPDGDEVSYEVVYCGNQNFDNCDPIQIVHQQTNELPMARFLAFSGTGTGFLVLGLLGAVNRRRIILVFGLLLMSYTLVSCSEAADQAGGPEKLNTEKKFSYTINTLPGNGAYYWKVISRDKGGKASSSEIWRFDLNR